MRDFGFAAIEGLVVFSDKFLNEYDNIFVFIYSSGIVPSKGRKSSNIWEQL
jgi:hypothetical protein